MLKAPYVHRVPTGMQLMDLNRVAYQPGQARGRDIRLMSVIITVMASLVYSVSKGFNVLLILTSISLLLSYSLSLHHLLLLSSWCLCRLCAHMHVWVMNLCIRMCRWLVGGYVIIPKFYPPWPILLIRPLRRVIVTTWQHNDSCWMQMQKNGREHHLKFIIIIRRKEMFLTDTKKNAESWF